MPRNVIGTNRTLSQAIRTVIDGAPVADFEAPLINNLSIRFGLGMPTFSRASIATVYGYTSAGAFTLLTIPSDVPLFEGARFTGSTLIAAGMIGITQLTNGWVLAVNYTNGKAYKSTDNGATWDAGTLIAVGMYNITLLTNGWVLAVNYTNGKAYKSTDNGATWDAGTLIAVGMLGITQLTNGWVLAVNNTTGKAHKSTDNGATWDAGTLIAVGMYNITQLTNGWVLATNNTTGKAYKSTDNGATWDAGTLIAAGMAAITQLTNGWVLAVNYTTGKAYKSTDNGATWDAGTLIAVGMRVITQLTNGWVLAVNYTNGKAYKSTDNGATWENTWENTISAGTAIADNILKGYLAEGSRTNLLLNSAVVVNQNITVTATATTLSFSGTGTITLSGVFSGVLEGTGASNRVSLTFTPTAGTLILTVTGSVTLGQVEVGAFTSSYIQTTTASVTRITGLHSIPVTNILATQGSLYFEYQTDRTPTGTIFFLGSYLDASNYFAILHDGTNLIARKRVTGVNYDSSISNPFVAGTRYKVGIVWTSTKLCVFLNGVKGTQENTAITAALGATAVEIGSDGNGANHTFANIRNFKVWKVPLTDTQLIGLTS